MIELILLVIAIIVIMFLMIGYIIYNEYYNDIRYGNKKK